MATIGRKGDFSLVKGTFSAYTEHTIFRIPVRLLLIYEGFKNFLIGFDLYVHFCMVDVFYCQLYTLLNRCPRKTEIKANSSQF
jgi:hypothetical protein